VVRLLAFLLSCACPCAVSAQPWLDAYRAGDYQKAADELHSIVTDPDVLITLSDPAPPRHLAMLYAQGLGVPRDSIAACSLAQIADQATHFKGPEQGSLDARQFIALYHGRLEESQAFVRTHCDGLSSDDRMTAGRTMGCFAFGMPEEVLTVGPHSVRIAHDGIGLSGTPPQDRLILQCPQMIARVRGLTIEPPDDAAPGVQPRYLVEVLSWHAGRKTGDAKLSWLLQWQIYEVSRKGIGFGAMEDLESGPGLPRPGVAPDAADRVSLEMIRSGHVRWRIDGSPPRRGWIMLPEETRR